jgi:TonB family protein
MISRALMSRASAAALAALFLTLATPAYGSTDSQVHTRTALLVGFPDAEPGDGAGALVVPGTVIPLEPAARRAAQLEAEAQRGEDLAQVARSLERTLRLGRVEVLYTLEPALALGHEKELPPPSLFSSLRVTVELLGVTPQTATYRVSFAEGRRVLADSRVVVRRGERAVIGSVDGEETPFLFLVLEPQPPRTPVRPGEPRVVEGDIRPPVRLHSPPPLYTPEAREVRIQGVVIVQAVIDETGAVTSVRPLKGLPFGLTEAAVEAVRQWAFEPARDADGSPVAVYYNLTVNFQIEDRAPPQPQTVDEPREE